MALARCLISLACLACAYAVQLPSRHRTQSLNTEDDAGGWELRNDHYCAVNWAEAFGAHTNEPLESCKTKCASSPSCVAVSVGTNQFGLNNCVLCASTETKITAAAHNWDTYIKSPAEASRPVEEPQPAETQTPAHFQEKTEVQRVPPQSGCSAISAAVNAVPGINHWSITGYSAGNNQISDGGGDMYDGGNIITTGDGNQVVYTDNCAAGTAGSQSYNMDIVSNGITTLTLDSMTSDRLQTDGNLGADGSGSRTNRVFNYNGWTAFWRQTHSASDPSVTHIWITNAASPQHESSNGDTNNDLDYVSGVQGASVIYLHWGETAGAEVSEAQFQAVVEAAVNAES